MFYNCESLKELSIENYNTNNVIEMFDMFNGCLTLTNLNMEKINTEKVKDMKRMFLNCPEELRNKIKEKYKNIKEEAFV